MKRTLVVVLAVIALVGGQPRADAPAPAKAALHTPTMAQFMSAGYPVEMVAATRADRIAWIANDKGLRNVFTAAAPTSARRSSRDLCRARSWQPFRLVSTGSFSASAGASTRRRLS